MYQFIAQLHPEKELRLFFNELLSAFELDIEDGLLEGEGTAEALRERLSHASFNSYMNFIGSLSVIIKQMGRLLIDNGFLDKIT